MEFSIKLNEQDICATKPETVASLFMALREISLDSMKVAEQKADKMVDTVVNTHHTAQKKEETAKKVETSEAKAKKEEPKPKAEESAPAKEEPKSKAEEPVPAKEEPKEEPEKTEEPAETATADEEKPEIDREAIVEKIKKIAFEGKAEGKPKKMKTLLAEYGVEKLPDLPDDKLPEFLKKVEAL